MDKRPEYFRNKEEIIGQCQEILPIARDSFKIKIIATPNDLKIFKAQYQKSNLGVSGIPAVYRSDADIIFIYLPNINADGEITLRHEYAHAFSGDQMYLCWCPKGSKPEEGIFWAEAFAEYFGINKGKDITTLEKVYDVDDIKIPIEFISFKKDGNIYYSSLPAFALHLIIQNTDVNWDLIKRVANNEEKAYKKWETIISEKYEGLIQQIQNLFEKTGYNKEYYIQGLKIVLDQINKQAAKK